MVDGEADPENVVPEVGPGGVDFDGHEAVDLAGPDVGGVLEGGLGFRGEVGVRDLDGGHGTAEGGRWGREGKMVFRNADQAITSSRIAGRVVVHGRGGQPEHLLGPGLDRPRKGQQPQAQSAAPAKRS